MQSVSEELPKGQSAISNHHGGAVRAAICVDQTLVSVWLSYKGFQIDDVVEENGADGPKRLKIQFAVKHPTDRPRPPNALDTDGWFVVSPEEGWIIREYGKFSSRNGVPSNSYIGKIEYARSPDGHLDPVKYTRRVYERRVPEGNPGKPVSGFDLTFKSVRYDALPESEFRLPAFGMPDVRKGKEGASTARPYGVFALATVGFGLAGGLKYLSSRIKRS